MKRNIVFLLIIILGQSLLSAQTADTTKNELYGWKLLNCFLVEPFDFDTTITDFQIFNLNDKYSISNISLGSVGKPWKSNIYSGRIDIPFSDFYFDQNYYLDLLTADNQVFYHSKKPYFEISWNTAPKKRKENQLNVLYTQNINKKWNVGLRYRLITSGGEYQRAQTSQHSLNPFVSYKGERYSMHAAFIRNKIKAQENGGVEDNIEDPEFAKIYLESASSIFFKRSFFISQQYKFGFNRKIVVDDTTTIDNFKEFGRLNYVIRFDKNYRVYEADGDSNEYIYKDFFLNKKNTHDSIFLSKIENTVYWSFKEIDKENFKGRLTIGGTYELLKQAMIDEQDTSYGFDSVYTHSSYHSVKMFGNLSARTKNFLFNVDASYYPVGQDKYKENDYEANVIISKSINIFKQKTSFYARLGYKNTSPDLFLQNYVSNHFIWHNDFVQTSSSNSRFGIEIPKLKFSAELLLGTIKNYIYFDSITCSPKQTSDLLNVVSLSACKNFKVWHLSSKNRVVYHLPTSSAELRLPTWGIYHSFYFDKFFDYNKKHDKLDIEVQFGYDLNFTSRFDADGYVPSTGIFYQSNYRTGNYAIINAFINLRIKNVLLSGKMEHVNSLFLIDKSYYIMKDYPAETSIFKFGVSWRFQD